MTKEQKFHDTSKIIFVGAKVKGESGYTNHIYVLQSKYDNKFYAG